MVCMMIMMMMSAVNRGSIHDVYIMLLIINNSVYDDNDNDVGCFNPGSIYTVNMMLLIIKKWCL
jgi:hypothetical protein